MCSQFSERIRAATARGLRARAFPCIIPSWLEFVDDRQVFLFVELPGMDFLWLPAIKLRPQHAKRKLRHRFQLSG